MTGGLNEIEQSALSTPFCDPGNPTSVDRLLLASIGISLKRIADALTGETANIFTAPINSYGEGIGDAIQGQMVRGACGIDQYEGR